MKLVLEPLFEADFAPVSFGFRPKRSAHQAKERIRDGVRRGYRWAVDTDIRGFFDNLDHDLLLAMVGERVSADRRVLDLIAGWLRAGVFMGEGLLHPDAGTPQGGVASPLLRGPQAWVPQLAPRHLRAVEVGHDLGLTRLAGTVSYPTAHAAR